MGLLEMELLGGFALSYNRQPLTTLYQARERTLLAYLALHAQVPLARAFLAFHFWPDSTEKQARANLRHSLFQFRRHSPLLDTYLALDRDTVQWRTELPLRLDVADFLQVMTGVTAQSTPLEIRTALTSAQSLYRGEFMAGYYEEWILEMRTRLQQSYCQALRQGVACLEAERDYPTAVQYAQTLLHLDPLDEATQRTLMHLYALQGDLTLALQLYHSSVVALRDALAVAPEPQTTALYKQLAATRAQHRRELSTAANTAKLALEQRVPLVGRRREWQQLQAAWRVTTRGRAHLALICGEAGIGKTRLAEELIWWAEQLQIPTARAKAYAAEGRLPYAPIITWLRSPALQQRQATLHPRYLSELSRLLPTLLEEHPGLPIPTPLTDTWQRQTLFDAMVHATVPQQGALLLLLDDLQWCDQETLEWLHYLLRHATAPLLIMGTVRLEELRADHPLISLQFNLQATGDLTTIDLPPLSAQESKTLATQVAMTPIPEHQLSHLPSYTGGVPLFIVEMVRAGLEMRQSIQGIQLEGLVEDSSGAQRPALPPKVQALIQARLAQLSVAARELIELAAVIGRNFSVELLAQAAQMSIDTALAALDELWQRRLLREEHEQRYDIAHDRIRDVVYQAISPLRTRQFHWRVAQAIEMHHADDLGTVSGQLAGHYEQSGFFARAITYYQRAGEDARQIFANGEAIGYCRRGLHLLKALPANPAHDQQELDLLLAVGVALVSQVGYAAASVRETYLLANALSQKIGGSAGGPILRALAINAVTRGEFTQAYIYGEQLLHLAAQWQDPVLTVEAHYSLGVTVFWQGRFAESAGHLRQAIDGYHSHNREAHLKLFAQDPLPICQARYAGALWHLGDSLQADAWINQAVKAAEAEGHPHTVAYVLFWHALILHFSGDVANTLVIAQKATAYAETYQLPFWSNETLILWGWAEVHRGLSAAESVDRQIVHAGIAKITKGIAALQAIDTKFFLAYYTGLLAEIKAKTGNLADGAKQLTAALHQAQAYAESWCQAKLLQLQADIAAYERKDAAAVAAIYHQALALASQQEANAWAVQIAERLSQIQP